MRVSLVLASCDGGSSLIDDIAAVDDDIDISDDDTNIDQDPAVDDDASTDDDLVVLNPVVNGYEFVNLAGGAVDSITDLEDGVLISVVQTVPVVGDTAPSSVDKPINLFFNDKLLLESLFDNLLVIQNGLQINGTVAIDEDSNGFAILTFVSGPLGCIAATDGDSFAAISTGDALVSSGAAIGETSSTIQIGPISVADGDDSIAFAYNFVSAEFLEYVGFIFDDSSVLSITRPDGTFTSVLTTVNLVDESYCVVTPLIV